MALSPATARYLRMALSALSSGVIGAIAVLLTAATDATGDISQRAVLISLLTGISLMFKDVQAYLSTPPVPSPETVQIQEKTPHGR